MSMSKSKSLKVGVRKTRGEDKFRCSSLTYSLVHCCNDSMMSLYSKTIKQHKIQQVAFILEGREML
eukprot:749483-Hanusia_phi.AAC.8